MCPVWPCTSYMRIQITFATESVLRKYELACVTRDRWYRQGWDIGPIWWATTPDPLIRTPHWMGNPQRATSIPYIQTCLVACYLLVYLLQKDSTDLQVVHFHFWWLDRSCSFRDGTLFSVCLLTGLYPAMHARNKGQNLNWKLPRLISRLWNHDRKSVDYSTGVWMVLKRLSTRPY